MYTTLHYSFLFLHCTEHQCRQCALEGQGAGGKRHTVSSGGPHAAFCITTIGTVVGTVVRTLYTLNRTSSEGPADALLAVRRSVHVVYSSVKQSRVQCIRRGAVRGRRPAHGDRENQGNEDDPERGPRGCGSQLRGPMTALRAPRARWLVFLWLPLHPLPPWKQLLLENVSLDLDEKTQTDHGYCSHILLNVLNCTKL